MFRWVIDVQVGYIDVQEGYMLFSSGGLYVVTGGKQSQLLVHLTWTRLLDLDWSLTITKQTTTTTHHRKLNVSNISAVNGPILTKL